MRPERCFAIVFLSHCSSALRTPLSFFEKTPGDYIELETPVTIPTTEVKQFKPMVLAKTERVGHCQAYYFKSRGSYQEPRLFLCLLPALSPEQHSPARAGSRPGQGLCYSGLNAGSRSCSGSKKRPRRADIVKGAGRAIRFAGFTNSAAVHDHLV